MIEPVIKPIADYTPDEVRNLIPLAGPVYSDTPDCARTVLEERDEEIEEQVACFDDYLKAATQLLGEAAIGLLIIVVTVMVLSVLYHMYPVIYFLFSD